MRRALAEAADDAVCQHDRGAEHAHAAEEDDAEQRTRADDPHVEGFFEHGVFTHGGGEHNAGVGGVQFPHLLGVRIGDGRDTVEAPDEVHEEDGRQQDDREEDQFGLPN